MEQFKLVKINTGNAVHLAKYFEAPTGYKGYDVYCGSGKTGLRPRLYNTYQEVKIENITCKKCKKRYLEAMQEVTEESIELSIEDQLRTMVESGNTGFTITKAEMDANRKVVRG